MGRFKHGASKERWPEYFIWKGMHKRCKNPNANRYHVYGGRGITVCDRWKSFAAFIEDVGRRPSPQHQLERKDNDKGYEPDNVRWATPREQQCNRRNNVFIEYCGERLCISEWARRTGIACWTLQRRVRRGWTPEQILTTRTTRIAS